MMQRFNRNCACGRNEWPLDSMCLQCDVTKKNREDFSSPPREGAYIHGLYMEGARWDTQVLPGFVLWLTKQTQVQWIIERRR